MAVGIIVKKYDHFNTALPNWDTPKGVYVRSKDHYDRLVKQAGMVPCQEGEVTPNRKDYSLSREAKSIIDAAKNSKDKLGNVQLSDRTIDAMKKIGAIGKKIPSYMKLPKKYESIGGFSK